MAKNKKDTGFLRGIKSLTNDLRGLNKVSKELVDSATNSDTTSRDENLTGYMQEIDDIISRDFKKLTEYPSKDLSLFFMEFLKKVGSDNIDRFKSIEDVFEADSSGLLKHFQGEYANDITKIEDISMIVKDFSELREAIEVMRDSIVNADEHTNSISRELIFRGVSDTADQSNLVSQIESIEEEYNLSKHIKNHIIPRTLEYGEYFVYVVPYSHIFERYAVKKREDQGGQIGGTSLTSTLESVDMDFLDSVLESGVPVKNVLLGDKKKALASMNDVMQGISISNDDISIPVMESFDEVGALFESESKKTKVKVAVNDGVADIGSGKLDTDFSNVGGVYMKLIDPRKMIPVRVLGKTLGYYYMHDEAISVNRTPFSSRFHLDLTKGYNNNKENDFIYALSDRIVKGFNKPFLEKNVQFKENIAAALIHNDVYKRDMKFQFIPADHVASFVINETEDSRGVGMLDKSVFYAKLYLGLLHFNMITILSKSNDQRVYYIHSSGVEKNIANKIQGVARQIKSREMNYNDLFNYRSMVGKVGPGRDAFIPVGTNGNQGITFDILAGQQVELYSELMTMLKTSAINNTGVPSVVIDYVNQADYSRSIVMGNMRFLNRAISTQLELNPQITEFYKMILRATGSVDPEVIEGFQYKLSKPRTLDMTNITDMINNTGALAEFLVNNLSGESSDKDELDNMTRDIAVRGIVKDLTSSLGWTKFEDIWEDAVLKAKGMLEQRKSREVPQE